MQRAGRVTGVPFAFFANVDEVNARLLGLDIGIVNRDFFDALLRVIDQFEELRAVLHGGNSLAQI